MWLATPHSQRCLSKLSWKSWRSLTGSRYWKSGWWDYPIFFIYTPKLMLLSDLQTSWSSLESSWPTPSIRSAAHAASAVRGTAGIIFRAGNGRLRISSEKRWHQLEMREYEVLSKSVDRAVAYWHFISCSRRAMASGWWWTTDPWQHTTLTHQSYWADLWGRPLILLDGGDEPQPVRHIAININLQKQSPNLKFTIVLLPCMQYCNSYHTGAWIWLIFISIFTSSQYSLTAPRPS